MSDIALSYLLNRRKEVSGFGEEDSAALVGQDDCRSLRRNREIPQH